MPTTRSGRAATSEQADTTTGEKHMVDGLPPSPPPKSRKVDEQRGPTSKKPARGDEEGPQGFSSGVLERGIIYFFFRGRVGPADTDPADQQPSSVADVARSYLILRPVSDDGGPAAAGSNNSRLLMLPKKSLPLRPGRDRAVAVVEKSSSSPKELVESLGARDYETKTVGKRHEPAVTPAAEGVYALTRPSGNQEEDDGVQGPSHLAYLVTFPQELGEVQRALGLQRRGTLLVSTRNPEFPAPRNQAAPGAKAEYPKAIMSQFQSYRWIGTRPEHFDFEGTQLLLLSEKSTFEEVMERSHAAGDNGGLVMEEMEDLEEDVKSALQRAGGRDESAAIFNELEVRAKDYPKLQTEF